MRAILFFSAVFLLLVFSGIPAHADIAPRVYFAVSEKEFFAGEELRIAVFLDTPFPVNALNLELGFSPRTLVLLGFNDGSSIVDVWKDSPLIFEEGIVRLRGGILKSFSGNAGELIQLRFQGVREGKGQISLRAGKIYRGDGSGTEVALPVSFAEVTIRADHEGSGRQYVKSDTTPPKVTLETTKDPATERDLLVLSASDPESGVGESLVRFRRWFFWGRWQGFRNPMQIPSGTWEIQSKTMNGDGLAGEQSIYIARVFLIKSTLLLALIVIFVLASAIYHKRRYRNT